MASGFSALIFGIAAGCGGSPMAGGPAALPVSSTSGAGSTAASASVDPSSDAAILAAARAYLDAQAVSVRSANSAAFHAVTTADCNCRAGVETVVAYLKSHDYREDVTYS